MSAPKKLDEVSIRIRINDLEGFIRGIKRFASPDTHGVIDQALQSGGEK